jgi:hypothetical protein
MSGHLPASEKHGRLRSKAHRRRLIDTWTFVSPFTKHIDEGTISVKVFLVNGFRGGTDTDGMSFEAFFPSKRLEFRNTDIEKLRRQVEEQFRKQDLARNGIEWEDWIELEIGGSTYDGKHDDPGAGLDLKYTIIKRGVDPKTGKLLTINNNHVVVPFPSAKKAGEEDPDCNKSHDKDDWRTWSIGERDEDYQYSYIPATPANVAAVESVIQRLRDLRAALNKVLNQDGIQKALATVWKDLPRLEHR